MPSECFYCNEMIDYLPFNCRYCRQFYCSKHRLPENHDCIAIDEKSLQVFQTKFSLEEAPVLSAQKKVLYSQSFRTNHQKFNRPPLLLIPLIIAFLIIPAMGTFSRIFRLIFKDNMNTLEDVSFYYKLSQFLTQMFCVLLLILISKICFNQSLRKGYRLDRGSLNVGMQVFLAMLFFSWILHDRILPFSAITRPLSTKELFFDLCAGLIGAPVLEELLFRKLLIPSLKQRGTGDLFAILFSALTFALAHVPGDIQGTSVVIVYRLVISRFIGGILLSLSFIKTKKVITCMLIHFLWNFYVTFNQYTLTYYEISILKTINNLFNIIIILSVILYIVYIIINIFSHKGLIWESMISDKPSPKVGQSIIITGGIFIITLTCFEIFQFKINSFENLLERIKTGLIYDAIVLAILILLGIFVNLVAKFKQKQINNL